MSIIDRKGKILGIINIIDLLIISVIVVLVVGGAYKFNKITTISEEGNEIISLDIEVESINEGLINEIKKGDILIHSTSGAEFGEILEKEVKPHKEVVIGEDGKADFKEIPGLFDVVIRLNSKGKFTDDGILIGNNTTYVGSDVRLKSSLYVFDSQVININR